MAQFIYQYWLEFFFGLICMGLGIGLKTLYTKVKKISIVEQAMRELLKDRIIQAYNHYIEKGFIPIYALESAIGMYEQYHALGGNGTITRLVNELKELPTEKQKKVKKSESKIY